MRIKPRISTSVICVAIVSSAVALGGLATKCAETQLPGKRMIRVPSPDGHWVLISSPLMPSGDGTLSIEESKTGQHTVVKHFERSLGVGWSPDSKAYFLNDQEGSNITEAYVYWPEKADPLRLDDLILKHDTEANAIRADHTYFRIRRWYNTQTLLVEYCGYSSESPTVQFDFFYRVYLTGSGHPEASIRRLSHKVGPIDLAINECSR
jgi:hypothetical protein